MVELLLDLESGPACDLWALGVILYMTLVGKTPFKGVDEFATFENILNMPVNFPEGFDQHASDFIEKLLRKNPMERLGYGKETTGYPSLKQHPFFANIDFNTLHLL